MNNPIVSVVMPVHNRSGLAERAIRSVLSQSEERFELIVIDDQSTEDIRGMVEGFQDGRIRFVRTAENVGGGAARNVGLEMANARYVAFLDSDDIWLPDKLKMDMTHAAEFGTDLIVSPVLIRKSGRTVRAKLHDHINTSLLDLIMLRNCVIQTSAVTASRALLSKVRFDQKLRRHQDLDLYSRLDLIQPSRHFHETPMVVWDISHEFGSISRTTDLGASLRWAINANMSSDARSVFVARFVYGRAASISEFFNLARAASTSLTRSTSLTMRGLQWFVLNRLRWRA